MHTLPRDPITGQPRLLAPARATRPHGPRPEGCPFCPGNEELTPPEIDRITVGGVWTARTIPNLYPLTERHEVIVMSPRHVTSTRKLTGDEWDAALALWVRRITALDNADAYPHVFVNDGREAGASLEHTHAQVVVVPREPEVDALTARTHEREGCPVCSALTDESLLVWRNQVLVLVAHPAPRVSHALLLAPIDHSCTVSTVDTGAWAESMRVAVNALPAEAPFNLWLAHDDRRGAHWYVEIVPRSARIAGVELALGVGVALTRPVDATMSARERVASESARSVL